MNPDGSGEFLAGNYLDGAEHMETDETGRFYERIRIKVRKKHEEIDSLVTVLSPNKGEVFEPGSTQEISWENNFGGGLFKLSYSTNNGKDWKFIGFGNDSKDGSRTVKKYDWEVPGDISSDSCLVRVEDNEISKLYDISDSLFSISSGTGIDVESIDDKIPDKFSLDQNYPNPFNPSTKIGYDLPKTAKDVDLTIYNTLGKEVAKFEELPTGAGSYEVQWDTDRKLSSGVYYYNLKVDDKIVTKSMVLMK